MNAGLSHKTQYTKTSRIQKIFIECNLMSHSIAPNLHYFKFRDGTVSLFYYTPN